MPELKVARSIRDTAPTRRRYTPTAFGDHQMRNARNSSNLALAGRLALTTAGRCTPDVRRGLRADPCPTQGELL
jgi:hypothetical protein